MPQPAGTGNTNANPQFVNAGNGYGLSHTLGDYHLSPGSPCVNAGNDALVNTPTDLDGKPRIARRPVDMGAYEVQAGRGTVFVVR